MPTVPYNRILILSWDDYFIIVTGPKDYTGCVHHGAGISGGHLRIMNVYVLLRYVCSAASFTGEGESLWVENLHPDKDWIPQTGNRN